MSDTHESALLDVRDLTVNRGSLEVLHTVSLQVARGETVAVLGPNGAGKTTLLLAISGVVPLASGDVQFDRDSIAGMNASQVVRRGIIHVPEGRHLFPHMSVEENVILGGYARHRRDVRANFEEVVERFPIIGERRRQQAGLMSGGEQQMIAIARGLMARPRLLLLDEPSIGLAPRVVRELGEAIRTLATDYGCSLVLVEQNVGLALDVASRAYVLDLGRVSATGGAAAIAGDERLTSAYLGDRGAMRDLQSTLESAE
jgi:branched-chain amino acid transport system ATP-binding protein